MSTSAGTTNGARPISPPSAQGIKRERSSDEEEEEQTRRVARRTVNNNTATATANGNHAANNAANTKNESSMIVDYVKTINKTNDVQTLQTTLKELAVFLFVGDDRTKEQRKANRDTFLRVGGPLAVVTTMDEHQESKKLQDRAIWVLQNATCRHDENKKVIAEVDGIQAILGAMTKYPSSKLIQRGGIGALGNVCCGLEANKKLLVLQLNGIGSIMKAMQSFPNDEKTVLRGCKLLSNLGDIESLKQSLRNANAFSILGAALDNHKNNPDIQRCARNALKKLV